ncbi:MAG: hypothetical protein EA376_02010 [Phycisphaeraceae bacterium]|nr:MAG: hypothetical protein EA376_02010 [Phycisphaeraceae bacterium]
MQNGTLPTEAGPALLRLRPFGALARVAIAALGLALAGCGTTFPRTFDIDATPAAGIPAIATPTAVDASNNRGGVVVRIDPRLDTIHVAARIRVSDRVEKEEREALAEQVSVWAHLDEANGRAVLRVGVESGRPDEDDHRVDLRITMPRCDGVLVRAAGGDVVLVGVGGSIQVENSRGAIELRTARVLNDPVALFTDRGNIYYQAPPGSSGLFELRSLDGIVTMASIDRPRDVYATRDLYRGVINDGANPVTIQTGEGNVRAWIREDPEALVRMFR